MHMKKFNLENDPKITSGFTIPDSYFDKFSEKILAQLPEQEPKVVSIFSYRKTWHYAAVAILILMLSIPIYTKYSTQKEEIDSATLENYIAYQSNISEEEIVNLLQQEDLDNIKLEFIIEDTAIEDAFKTNSNLEQYIID